MAEQGSRSPEAPSPHLEPSGVSGTHSPEPLPLVVWRQPLGCPGDGGCLALIEGLSPQAASHLHLLWEPVADLLEAAQAVRCLGAGKKRQRGPQELSGRNGGEPRLASRVVPDLAERGLASACLGGCPLKWLS